MFRWKALLAPLGEVSDDGRRLDHVADRPYTVVPGAPLYFPPDPNPAKAGITGTLIAGRVEEVWAAAGDVSTAHELWASGTADDGAFPDLPEKMRTRQVRPELDLDAQPAFLDAEPGSGHLMLAVFTGGRVAAVAIGRRPTFDNAHFTVDDEPAPTKAAS